MEQPGPSFDSFDVDIIVKVLVNTAFSWVSLLIYRLSV